MEVSSKGYVGPYQVSDGSETEIRLDKQGSQTVVQAHPRYYEMSSRGYMYGGANQAAQAVSVALATTYTGLLLYNPVGSGKVLVPTKVKFALSVAPAAIATIGLIRGYAASGGVTAFTAEITAESNQIGNTSTSNVGRVLNQATIVTPTWCRQLRDGFTAAALPAPTMVDDLEGDIIILPGGFIAIGALTAVTGLGSISWEEVSL